MSSTDNKTKVGANHSQGEESFNPSSGESFEFLERRRREAWDEQTRKEFQALEMDSSSSLKYVHRFHHKWLEDNMDELDDVIESRQARKEFYDKIKNDIIRSAIIAFCSFVLLALALGASGAWKVFAQTVLPTAIQSQQ